MAEQKEIDYNRKPNFDYEILEKFEVGIVLRGSEVKSLRSHKVNMTDAYAGLSKNKEVFIYRMHIHEYSLSNRMNHDQISYNLLLRRKKIQKLVGQLKKSGYTLVPISINFNEKGFIKL